MGQIDFPPMLLAALIRRRFSNIHSGNRVLINIAKNIKYGTKVNFVSWDRHEFVHFIQNDGRSAGVYMIKRERVKNNILCRVQED